MNWTEEDLRRWTDHHVEEAPSFTTNTVSPPRSPLPAAAPAPRPHKYGVSPKEERTIDGALFASKAEAHAYQTLKMLKDTGQIVKLERQPRFSFPMGFSYVADFDVTYDDGSRSIIDVKGMETPEFKLKRKCFEYFYPELKLDLWRR